MKLNEKSRMIDTKKARGEMEEDLLESIYRLWRQDAKISTKEYARENGVTGKEAASLVRGLVKKGFLCEPEKNGLLELTEKGKLAGMNCLARHEKLTQFFQLIGGMEQENAQQDECRIEHYISPEGLRGIENFLQYGDVYDRVYDEMDIYSFYEEGFFKMAYGLYELEGAEKKRGVQRSIAEHCEVNCSTVNRYFKNCIERGILTESLTFTEEGKEWWQRYSSLYQRLFSYLQEIGGKTEEAKKTAELMIENIDIHMLELMLSAYTRKKSIYAEKKEQYLDREIQENLQKCERHRVVFRLYRMNRELGKSSDSMAMGGFEETAEIVQKERKSYLELRVKDMAATSRVNGQAMVGHLKKKLEN